MNTTKSILELTDRLEEEIGHGLPFWRALARVINTEIPPQTSAQECENYKRDVTAEYHRRIVGRIKPVEKPRVMYRQSPLSL